MLMKAVRDVRPRVRIQKARDFDDDDYDNDDSTGLDDNDFLIYQGLANASPIQPTDEIEDARLFLAHLVAQRRSVIFTSDLSERVYNVWLPATVLEPRRDADEFGAGLRNCQQLVAFPFLTIVRKPQSQRWRNTFSLTILFAPTQSTSIALRRVDAHEIGTVVKSLDGPSSNPAIGGNTVYGECPPRASLSSYLRRLYDDDDLSSEMVQTIVGADAADPSGTIRQWTEALLLTLARRQSRRTVKTPAVSLRDTAGDVLRSIRTSSLWSVLVGTRELHPASHDESCVFDGSWWPPDKSQLTKSPVARMPESLMEVFDEINVGRTLWFRPTRDRRIDQIDNADRSWMSWAPPQRPAIVSFYCLEVEDFPLRSGLNLFVWLLHAAIGAVTARAIMNALGVLATGQQDVADRARPNLDLIVELEEMFDLDVAAVVYRRFYRRLRALRGLDDQYAKTRERADLIGRYRDVIDRNQTEKLGSAIALGGAILAVGVLVGTIALFVVTAWGWINRDLVAGVALGLWLAGVLCLEIYLEYRGYVRRRLLRTAGSPLAYPGIRGRKGRT
jgi:hypothetical protein